jgi:hypothetical protein
MINPILWGRVWDFLHQLAWIFPNELLSQTETKWIIQFIQLFSRILPCIECSQSAAILIKDLNFEHKFQFLPIQSYARSHIAKFFWMLHNRVNMKLGKPIFGSSWYDSIQVRNHWRENYLRFLFSLGYNLLFQQEEGYQITYNEFDDHYQWIKYSFQILKYDSQFQIILNKFSPSITKMIQYPLNMIYFCQNALNIITNQNVSLYKIELFFQLGKPKKDCETNSESSEQLVFYKTSKQGCQ